MSTTAAYRIPLAFLVGLTAVGAALFWIGDEAEAQRGGLATPAERSATLAAPAGNSAGLTPEELANIRVYETVNRSVVNITTSTMSRDPVFGMPIGGKGAGSGMILDREGHILTNEHVVEDAQSVQVTLASGVSYNAELVGLDAEYDMAVLRIDAPAESLEPIRVGRSESLRIGQKAYALGNPFGLGGTLTVGVVSNLNRSLPSRVTDRTIDGMIQTDAAMNPGNSGGPLLNSAGEMVGMCVAIKGPAGQNSGVGFAIPANRIRRFVPELLEHGKVIRAYHGIVMLHETSRGLRIAKVSPGGPADEAGLRGFRMLVRTQRRGPIVYREQVEDREYADYLLAIDDTPVRTHEDFLEVMDGYKPGDRIVVLVMRDGRELRVPVTLGSA